MRRAFLILIVAALAAACGKKQAPASPTPPPGPEDKKTEDKPDGASDPDAMPRRVNADPCEGGEDPK